MDIKMIAREKQHNGHSEKQVPETTPKIFFYLAQTSPLCTEDDKFVRKEFSSYILSSGHRHFISELYHRLPLPIFLNSFPILIHQLYQ